jgi:hypothetical protein
MWAYRKMTGPRLGRNAQGQFPVAVFRPLPPKENAGLHASCRLYEHLAWLRRNGRHSGKSPILGGIAVTHMRGEALL